MSNARGAIWSAFAAAALFGASTPLVKLLVGELSPLLLAGLLYLGSGLGLAIITMGIALPVYEIRESQLRLSSTGLEWDFE
ncbi:MAG TPA: hypothetical protein VMV78_06295 [Thiobacillus sp.]|jgi:hypothetical protein|nr:hypothetical protein [Thiobacillus sp.]